MQVIDMPALPGNYEESSASAMFAYALLRLDRLGLGAGRQRGSQALARLTALVEERARTTGTPVLPSICHVAGLGGFGGRDRDGTPAYYLSEVVVDDDVKGVGPLFMAVGEDFIRSMRLRNAAAISAI